VRNEWENFQQMEKTRNGNRKYKCTRTVVVGGGGSGVSELRPRNGARDAKLLRVTAAWLTSIYNTAVYIIGLLLFHAPVLFSARWCLLWLCVVGGGGRGCRDGGWRGATVFAWGGVMLLQGWRAGRMLPTFDIITTDSAREPRDYKDNITAAGDLLAINFTYIHHREKMCACASLCACVCLCVPVWVCV